MTGTDRRRNSRDEVYERLAAEAERGFSDEQIGEPRMGDRRTRRGDDARLRYEDGERVAGKMYTVPPPRPDLPPPTPRESPSIAVRDVLLSYSEWLDGEKIVWADEDDERTHAELVEAFIDDYSDAPVGHAAQRYVGTAYQPEGDAS